MASAQRFDPRIPSKIGSRCAVLRESQLSHHRLIGLGKYWTHGHYYCHRCIDGCGL
jgi:hypothetical protein